MLPAIMRKRHVHSVLFLISRALFICALIPSWKTLRSVVVFLLSLCSLHQVFLYLRRMQQVDERTFSFRASPQRIHQSTGPIGKLFAAFHVYLWEFSSHPHPVNLLHWLEVALLTIILGERIKNNLALQMQLEFFWYSRSLMLCMKQVSRMSTEEGRDKIFGIVFNICKRVLSLTPTLASRFSESVTLSALHEAPSFIIFLFWLVFGRESFSYLQSDPRGRAYHMDSFCTHSARQRGIERKRSVMPKAFGVDMSQYFDLGLSRKISVEEIDDPESMEGLRKELMKDRPMIFDEDIRAEGPVDHESVYCLSYRHLEDKNDEAVVLLTAVWLAAQIAKAAGYQYFRVWMDKILRQRPGRDSGRWAFYGLLPYAYYPVIAVRNTTEDEGERMWLLAEERLAYGNMGLYTIDANSDPPSFDFTPGLLNGPEHSIRLYLRYLKTEESAEEKTFHLRDKQIFKELADRHGTTDDEGEMFEGLCFETKPKPAPLTAKLWWSAILDVETYSALRKQEAEIDLIEFVRAENVQFDGYREWFKWKDKRVYPIDGTQPRITFEENILYQAKLVTAYACETDLYSVIVLTYRGKSGTLYDKAACICLRVEKQDDGFRVLECKRISLRYNTGPSDDDFLKVVVEQILGSSREDENLRIVRINPRDLDFL